MDKKIPVTVQLFPDEKTRADRMAKKKRVPLSAFIREAVLAYLKQR